MRLTSQLWLLIAAAASATSVDLRLFPGANLNVDHDILLSEPLFIEQDSVHVTGSGKLMIQPATGAECSPVLRVRGARNVTIGAGLSVLQLPPADGTPAACAAIEIEDSPDLRIVGATVVGGISIRGACPGAAVGWCDISNPHGAGAANGTCLQVVSCGNSSTLSPCNITLHDNAVHDCRTASGGSPYAPAAQGILLGGADDAPQCTVGVLVRNNNLTGIDEMGIRINNDNHCPSVGNVVELNKVERWGQLAKAAGGDATDSGCLYVYGHWYSPGNILRYNYCVSYNSSEGQNGVYLDDASTGQIVVGNVFRGAVGGVALKVNGGAFNHIDSIVAIQGGYLGFANCRGLRGTSPAQYYTCENEGLWMSILAGAGYLQPPWSVQFPWYTGWCSNTTAGPFNTPCAPAGAPAGYECASLSRGNRVSNVVGIQMTHNGTFAIPTAPGFPNGTGTCPQFVVDGQFNAVDNSSINLFFGNDQFVDAAGGDYTLRNDSDVYAALPSFARIPFRSIGIGGSGNDGKPHAVPRLLA